MSYSDLTDDSNLTSLPGGLGGIVNKILNRSGNPSKLSDDQFQRGLDLLELAGFDEQTAISILMNQKDIDGGGENPTMPPMPPESPTTPQPRQWPPPKSGEGEGGEPQEGERGKSGSPPSNGGGKSSSPPSNGGEGEGEGEGTPPNSGASMSGMGQEDNGSTGVAPPKDEIDDLLSPINNQPIDKEIPRDTGKDGQPGDDDWGDDESIEGEPTDGEEGDPNTDTPPETIDQVKDKLKEIGLTDDQIDQIIKDRKGDPTGDGEDGEVDPTDREGEHKEYPVDDKDREGEHKEYPVDDKDKEEPTDRSTKSKKVRAQRQEDCDELSAEDITDILGDIMKELPPEHIREINKINNAAAEATDVITGSGSDGQAGKLINIPVAMASRIFMGNAYRKFASLCKESREMYRPDEFSKKVVGLFGRNTTNIGTKKFKKVLFIIDLSGSMDKNILSVAVVKTMVELRKINRTFQSDVLAYADRCHLFTDTGDNRSTILATLNSASVGTCNKEMSMAPILKKYASDYTCLVYMTDFQFYSRTAEFTALFKKLFRNHPKLLLGMGGAPSTIEANYKSTFYIKDTKTVLAILSKNNITRDELSS